MPSSRALLSVSDKTGLVELATCLLDHGFEILSTGGTAEHLMAHAIPVTDISSYTGFPEIMGGRVKTLHPKIHGGILYRRGMDEAVLNQHDIEAIDLVVVNLYPFNKVICDPQYQAHDDFEALAIEHIDIGGPTLIRAAAKNYQYVTVLTDPNQYEAIMAELHKEHAICLDTRKKLAQKAFAHTAGYDAIIATFFSESNPCSEPQSPFPMVLQPTFTCQSILRYGENPHQKGAFYVSASASSGTIGQSIQHQGKELSYNNLADADAALECVKQFTTKPCCVIVKHANPCGVACYDNQLTAYLHAYACDPTSAFGGIIAFNTALEASTADKILNNQFVELIIAPTIHAEALAILSRKPNIRVLSCGPWFDGSSTLQLHSISGGLLVQEPDIGKVDVKKLRIVTQAIPTDEEMNDLIFAWQVAKFVKSNAIVYAAGLQTVGIGAGQMSRIDSAKIAADKAHQHGLSLANAVMASDAFFPFSDAIDYAVKQGIKAIIQPGGSIHDEEIIQYADKLHLAMVLTGMRHFKH